MKVDFDKFATYCKPGPRYTSYPTANEFHENFSYENYLDYLSSESSPISIYVHLPFCRSACYFCGCNVLYTSKDEKKSRYVDYLRKELKILKRYINPKREVVQLHLGGGTPTFMSAEELQSIFEALNDTFINISLDSENSCEIDPRYFSKEQMEVLSKNKINRLSFGVQDFSPKVQEAIHRIQPKELVEEGVKMARDFGINSINFDLIYGLPHQNKKSFEEMLFLVEKISPDRLAIFNYAHLPWLKKSMRKINEHDLPSPEEKLRILESSISFLQDSGYKMIGMDHFAKPHDELYLALKQGTLRRNFQGYTTKQGSQTIGIGLTSIGEGTCYYAQNYKELDLYERAIDDNRLPLFKGIELSLEDRLRKSVIMQLMSNFYLSFDAINTAFGIDFVEYFKDEMSEIKAFCDEGLMEFSLDGLRVTDDGVMLIRNLVMPFDTFLRQNEARHFSKTI